MKRKFLLIMLITIFLANLSAVGIYTPYSLTKSLKRQTTGDIFNSYKDYLQRPEDFGLIPNGFLVGGLGMTSGTMLAPTTPQLFIGTIIPVGPIKLMIGVDYNENSIANNKSTESAYAVNYATPSGLTTTDVYKDTDHDRDIKALIGVGLKPIGLGLQYTFIYNMDHGKDEMTVDTSIWSNNTSILSNASTTITSNKNNDDGMQHWGEIAFSVAEGQIVPQIKAGVIFNKGFTNANVDFDYSTDYDINSNLVSSDTNLSVGDNGGTTAATIDTAALKQTVLSVGGELKLKLKALKPVMNALCIGGQFNIDLLKEKDFTTTTIDNDFDVSTGSSILSSRTETITKYVYSNNKDMSFLGYILAVKVFKIKENVLLAIMPKYTLIGSMSDTTVRQTVNTHSQTDTTLDGTWNTDTLSVTSGDIDNVEKKAYTHRVNFNSGLDMKLHEKFSLWAGIPLQYQLTIANTQTTETSGAKSTVNTDNIAAMTATTVNQYTINQARTVNYTHAFTAGFSLGGELRVNENINLNMTFSMGVYPVQVNSFFVSMVYKFDEMGGSKSASTGSGSSKTKKAKAAPKAEPTAESSSESEDNVANEE